MLKLYLWNTPNGYKVPIMLEELGLPYEIHPIDISKGAQKTPDFLAMNPNHKIPVLVDEAAAGGPITIFESGAILLYLAELHGKFLSTDTHKKYSEIEWLMFQMASIGPMFGQASHFIKYAPERIEYAVKRYSDEARRLIGVMETRLATVPYLGGDYSIADMATWPWIRSGNTLGITHLDEFPSVSRWFKAIEARPAVTLALKKTDEAAKGAPAVCIPKFD
jgi:GSH-dependent disulfide-bond oxidoreductase